MTTLSQPEADKILHSPVSKRRRDAFLEVFRDDRNKTATMERVFANANAFEKVIARPNREVVDWTGFNVLLQKAPFTDLPNWGPYRPRDFAVALERHLLAQLEKVLREAVEGRSGEPINRDARAVLEAFDGMTDELKERGLSPTLFVLTGPLGTQLQVDLQRSITDVRDIPPDEALGTTFRIMGLYRGSPILDIPESESPGIYAAGLSRFATLTRFGEEPEFELYDIDEAKARELLEKSPLLVSYPPPDSGNEMERIRQMQLKVGLKLFETYLLSVVDNKAVVGAPLVGPVREYEPEYSRS